MASVISRIIGVITRQGFPCLFHLLTGLYCPGCGGTRAFRALLAGNLLLSIRYHPLVAYMAVEMCIRDRRDNMSIYKEQLVLRDLDYCIIDEVEMCIRDRA